MVTHGAFVTVGDQDILAAIPAVAAGAGIFLEPAAAASWAGLLAAREQGIVGAGDRVVILGTGTGLKDVPAAMRAVGAAGATATLVAPELGAVEEALGGLVAT
jgi:threonine synthase